jgi:hypothetical protein
MTDGEGSQPGASEASHDEPGQKRPLIERIGLSAIALVLALMFGGISLAAWTGGEVFLAAMAGIGALMTAWAGAITLTRG